MKPISFLDALKQLLADHPIREREVQDPCDFRLYKPLDRTFEFQQCTFCEPITLGNVGDTVKLGLKFDRCTFKEPITWPKVTFSTAIEFHACRFSGYVDLTGSRLHGISFEDCTFDEKAYFEDAIFLPRSFSSQQRLHLAEFRMATFKDGAEFDKAKFFVSARFHKVTFFGTTTFFQVGFLKWAGYAIPHLDFSYAKIFGYVEFQQSLRIHPFLIDPRPIPTSGETPKIPVSADFRYVHVHTQHGLRFHTENLMRSQVLGTNLDACHFSHIKWPMVETHYPLLLKKDTRAFLDVRMGTYSFRKLLTSIRCAILFIMHWLQRILSFIGHLSTDWFPYDDPTMVRGTTMESIPAHGSRPTLLSRLKRYWRRFKIYWRGCQDFRRQHGIYDHVQQLWRQEAELSLLTSSDDLDKTVKEWRGQWTQLSRAYRDLKNAYEANKDYIYASDFHYAEKEMRRINHEVPRPTRLQLQLYWLVSGYGERVLRPIWWFLLIWFVSGIFYHCNGNVTRNPDSKSNKAASAADSP